MLVGKWKVRVKNMNEKHQHRARIAHGVYGIDRTQRDAIERDRRNDSRMRHKRRN